MRTASSSRAGQAMAEFVVGLVATICVFGGMVQLGLLALERSDAQISATASASEKAIADEYLPVPVDYTVAWLPGDDAYRHSADDAAVSGDPAAIAERIGERSRPGWIRRYDDETAFAQADDPAMLVEEYGMVRGSDSSVGIELLPVVRNWIFRENSITIRADAWSVWTKVE